MIRYGLESWADNKDNIEKQQKIVVRFCWSQFYQSVKFSPTPQKLCDNHTFRQKYQFWY